MKLLLQTESPRNSPAILLWAFSLSAAAVLWFVLVAGTSIHEVILGAVCASASTLFLFTMWRAQEEHIALHWGDILQVRHVPGQIARDAFLISRILFRDMFGLGRAQSLYLVHTFDASPPDSHKLAREALAVTYMTASPNSIVLGIHPRRNLMLVHQLAETPLPAMMRALGAGATK